MSGEPLFVVRAVGSCAGNLLVDDYDAVGSDIPHGITVHFHCETGFVLSLDDLEHVVKEAREYQATLADIHARVDPLLKPKGTP